MTEMRDKNGVQIKNWSPEIMAAFEKAWNEVIAEESAANPNFKRVFDSYSKFRERLRDLARPRLPEVASRSAWPHGQAARGEQGDRTAARAPSPMAAGWLFIVCTVVIVFDVLYAQVRLPASRTGLDPAAGARVAPAHGAVLLLAGHGYVKNAHVRIDILVRERRAAPHGLDRASRRAWSSPCPTASVRDLLQLRLLPHRVAVQRVARTRPPACPGAGSPRASSASA